MRSLLLFVLAGLVSASGGRPTVGCDSDGARRAHNPGSNYAATVTVPEGGVGAIKIGLGGTTDVVTGDQRAQVPLFFPVESDAPSAPAAATPASEQPASAAPRSAPLVAAVTFAALATLASIGAALRLRSRASGR
jgi:hypothetical protein